MSNSSPPYLLQPYSVTVNPLHSTPPVILRPGQPRSTLPHPAILCHCQPPPLYPSSYTQAWSTPVHPTSSSHTLSLSTPSTLPLQLYPGLVNPSPPYLLQPYSVFVSPLHSTPPVILRPGQPLSTLPPPAILCHCQPPPLYPSSYTQAWSTPLHSTSSSHTLSLLTPSTLPLQLYSGLVNPSPPYLLQPYSVVVNPLHSTPPVILRPDQPLSTLPPPAILCHGQPSSVVETLHPVPSLPPATIPSLAGLCPPQSFPPLPTQPPCCLAKLWPLALTMNE